MRSLSLIILGLVLVGCSSAGPTPAQRSPDPSSTEPSFEAATTLPTSPAASPVPTSTVPPADNPTAGASEAPLVGRVVRTLADEGLRVRTTPGTEDDATKLEPLLPLGTQLYVLEGLVWASGYPWYEVMPLPFAWPLPSGWVAAAGRDGEPWVEAVAFECPALPTDMRSLAALPPGVGLACFHQVPITVRARVIWCACDVDGAWYTPSWFFLGSGSPELLMEPSATTPPEDFGDWFVLNLDPAGDHPEQIPEGEVVEITGMFDHPAAASCTRTEPNGDPVPSLGCRTEFAVTRLVVIGS